MVRAPKTHLVCVKLSTGQIVGLRISLRGALYSHSIFWKGGSPWSIQSCGVKSSLSRFMVGMQMLLSKYRRSRNEDDQFIGFGSITDAVLSKIRAQEMGIGEDRQG